MPENAGQGAGQGAAGRGMRRSAARIYKYVCVRGWGQYMFSYMDCDLSYFRSESDAALTPMLKLHDR